MNGYNNNNNTQNYYQNPQNQQQTGYGYDYYKNLYHMFGGKNPIVERNMKSLRRLGFLCGSAMLGFVLVQNVFAIILSLLGMVEMYKTDALYQFTVSIILPFFYTLLPFAVIYLFYKPEQKRSVSVFGKVQSSEQFLYAVVAGLFLCTLSDQASMLFSGLANAVGIGFGTVDSLEPSTPLEFLIFTVSIAVVPALLEEIVFRGIVMQPLRKYGDKFAIIISSLLFALLHGNMVQIPFAFLAGIILGYFEIMTESIWTSITIHFLNNFFSVLISLIYLNHNKDDVIPYFICTIAIAIVGIFALILFMKKYKRNLADSSAETDKTIKTACFLCTPTIVIAILNSALTSIEYTKFTLPLGKLILCIALIVICIFIVKGCNRIKLSTAVDYNKMFTVSKVFSIVGTILLIFAVLGATLATN